MAKSKKRRKHVGYLRKKDSKALIFNLIIVIISFVLVWSVVNHSINSFVGVIRENSFLNNTVLHQRDNTQTVRY